MGKASGDDVSDELQAVEKEVDQLRERTQSLVSELERRIHERVTSARATIDKVRHAVDVRAQVREHPRAAAGIGAGIVIAVGVGIWWGVARSRRRDRFVPRMQRKAHALRLFLADPERHLRKKEPIGRRVLAAVLVTAATVLVRKLLEQGFARLQEPRRQRAAPRLPALSESSIPIT